MFQQPSQRILPKLLSNRKGTKNNKATSSIVSHGDDNKQINEWKHTGMHNENKKSLKYLKNKQEKACYWTTKGETINQQRKQGDNLQHIFLNQTNKQVRKKNK